jgi:hypothetical protein
MAKESDYQELLDRIAALQETVTDQLSTVLSGTPPYFHQRTNQS